MSRDLKREEPAVQRFEKRKQQMQRAWSRMIGTLLYKEQKGGQRGWSRARDRVQQGGRA